LTHILVAFERQVSFVKLLHNYLNLKYMMGTFFWHIWTIAYSHD